MDKEDEKLDERAREDLLKAGVDIKKGYPTFAFVNSSPVEVISSKIEGVYLLSQKKAREKFPFLKELLWSLIDPNEDNITKEAWENDSDGYFLYIEPGVKLSMPIQTCFYIKLSGYRQTVHNVIYISRNAKVHVTNGCAVASYLSNGEHLGITEIYIEDGGYLSYTMVHHWAPEVEVRPRTAVRVKKRGIFVSNYISLKEAKLVQMSPTAYLEGEFSRAVFNSVVYAPSGSTYDLGTNVIFKAQGTRAEVTSRSVSNGGKVIARGLLLAESPGVRGHLACDGLMLRDDGEIKAIPELVSRVKDAQLTHEAAVGRISDEELFYLTSRGLTEDEAISLIVKGFLSIKIPGLPPIVEDSINKTIELLEYSSM